MGKTVKAKKVSHIVEYAKVEINAEGNPEIVNGKFEGSGFMNEKTAETALRKMGITGKITLVRNDTQVYEMLAETFFATATIVDEFPTHHTETPTIL